MKSILILVLIFTVGLLTTSVSQADSMKAEIAVGLGYHLCEAHTSPPPLDKAFLCSGLLPSLENIEVEMLPVKTNSPNVKLYQGSHSRSVEFDQYVMTAEFLVMMMVESNGARRVFIDGRILDNTTDRFSYFRVTAPDSFDKLSYTTVYGVPIYHKHSGTTSQLAAHLAFGPKY